MPVITDYETMRLLAIRAANEYLAGKSLFDNDGLVHGKEGRIRAKKMKKYLENSVGNHAAIIAIVLAIVEKPNLFSMWGYSSRLAGLIARRIISGESQMRFFSHFNNLRTSVISADHFGEIIKDSSNESWDFVGEGFYFNHIKGLRDLMERVLYIDVETAEQRREIQLAAGKLKADFKKNNEINEEVIIDLSLLPSFEMHDFVANQPRR